MTSINAPQKVNAQDWTHDSAAEPTAHVWLGIASFVGLFIVIRNWSAPSVQADFFWQIFYACGGYFIWVLQIWRRLCEFLSDILLRQDVRERKNPAAALALAANILGNTICYAGANIGDGPGPQAVFFSALLTNGTFTLGFVIFSAVTKLNDCITIDRERFAALRLASFSLGLSLILGKSVIGNWIDASQTVLEFLPALATSGMMLAAALFCERWLQCQKTSSKWPTLMFSLLFVTGSVLLAYLL